METIESARYTHSDGMGAYMSFMAVRLLAAMRHLLKPTGSIYLHCDSTAGHHLQANMDAIFVWRNFRNEIVWCKVGWPTKKSLDLYERIIKASSNEGDIVHDPSPDARPLAFLPRD